MSAGMAVKGEGKANDLLDRVAADPAFEPVHGKLESLVDPVLFIGRSPEQVCYGLVRRCNFLRISVALSLIFAAPYNINTLDLGGGVCLGLGGGEGVYLSYTHAESIRT